MSATRLVPQDRRGRILTRRALLGQAAKAGAGLALLPLACSFPGSTREELWVNDVHSRLNRTRVLRIVRPESIEAVQRAVRQASAEGRALSIAAARHAMGGQQFGTDTILIDMSAMGQVLELDPERGEVEAGAGIQWPELIHYLIENQRGAQHPWGIIQKQTGADRLSLGGALAANAHGRGLRFKPIAGDIAAFTLVDASGAPRRCSRTENADLFRLAIGGYGLFGIVAAVRLRLAPRLKLQRVVEVIDAHDLARRFEERIASGFLYGDFQYSTDLRSETLLRQGVFSCYRPVDPLTPIPPAQRELSEEDWLELIRPGHTDRGRAFQRYAEHYLETSGQIYGSDTHQTGPYLDAYHSRLRESLGALAGGNEMITEIYVPLDALSSFLEKTRSDILRNDMNLIYGTVGLIERDDETFLAWARQRYACVIFNLHTGHGAGALRNTKSDFRRLIDRGIEHGGSYFLTYHRWATREQVLSCYPHFPEFLRLKRKHDPEDRFQSDWYRHHRALLGGI